MSLSCTDVFKDQPCNFNFRKKLQGLSKLQLKIKLMKVDTFIVIFVRDIFSPFALFVEFCTCWSGLFLFIILLHCISYISMSTHILRHGFELEKRFLKV